MQREPYLKEKESPRTLYGNDRYVGFVIDVMDAISEIENFTYVIMLNHEGIGWYNSLKQSWTGMIGDIQTKVYFCNDIYIQGIPVKMRITG